MGMAYSYVITLVECTMQTRLFHNSVLMHVSG